jgi:hypothetical protein
VYIPSVFVGYSDGVYLGKSFIYNATNATEGAGGR